MSRFEKRITDLMSSGSPEVVSCRAPHYKKPVLVALFSLSSSTVKILPSQGDLSVLADSDVQREMFLFLDDCPTAKLEILFATASDAKSDNAKPFLDFCVKFPEQCEIRIAKSSHEGLVGLSRFSVFGNRGYKSSLPGADVASFSHSKKLDVLTGKFDKLFSPAQTLKL